MVNTIAELIRAFDVFDGVYKRAEMETALTLREEITPHLLKIIETVAQDPVRYLEEGHYANVYAAILLAHFKEPAAHLPIIRAFCIPEEETREDLWGDMVTATLPALLYQTCAGSFEAIRNLAEDKDVYSYVRGAAHEAMTYGVATGVISREEVIDYFLGLFTGEEADRDSYFWSNLVALICDMHPEGAMETIRRAYEDGLVFPGYVKLEEVEVEMQREKEKVLADLRVHVEGNIPSDVHDYCAWFSCFQDKEQSSLHASEPAFPQSLGGKGNKKSQNRSRNKMARKSRKRNKR